MATMKPAKRTKPVKLTDQYLRTIAVPLDAPDARITIRDMIVPRFEDRVAKDITRRDVRALVEDIAQRAPVHANRILALVKGVLAVAVDRELLSANVAAGLPRPTKEQPRTKVLTVDEVRAILTALDNEPADLHDFVRLRLLTATRGGELALAKWEHVDLAGKTLTIPAEVAKAGKMHRVPLVEEAVAILRARQEAGDGSPFVFPATRSDAQVGRRTGLQHVYKRLRVESGVAFVGHDLRRCWA